MRIYTVHENPAAPAEEQRIVFVKEGFNWPALFVPVLWMLYHRLWIVLGGFVLALVALSGLAQLAGLSEDGVAICSVVLQLLVAFEANDLRRWTLERGGYRQIAVVGGPRLDEAERVFFRSYDETVRPPAPDSPPPMAGPSRGVWPKSRTEPGDGDDVLGLFPRPGG